MDMGSVYKKTDTTDTSHKYNQNNQVDDRRLDKRLVDIILSEQDLGHQQVLVEDFREELDSFVGRPRGIYYPAMQISSLPLKKKIDYFTAPHHIFFHSKHNLVHFYLKFSSDILVRVDESRKGMDSTFTIYSHLFSGVNGSSKVDTQLHYKAHSDYKGKPLLYRTILTKEIPQLLGNFFL